MSSKIVTDRYGIMDTNESNSFVNKNLLMGNYVNARPLS